MSNNLLSRTSAAPNICGISIAFNGSLIPGNIEGWQPFYNALENGTDFQEAYFGRASVAFAEESTTSNAGISYKQSLSIQYPVSDSSRALRISQIHLARFIKIRLSNNKDLVIGRNDFEQNTRPVITAKADEKLAQITFETVSIFPSGYIPNTQAYGLPALIPIDLLNTD